MPRTVLQKAPLSLCYKPDRSEHEAQRNKTDSGTEITEDLLLLIFKYLT